MSVMKRLSGIVQAKANKALDKAENPADMLDLTYEKQLENLQKVSRALADVATAKKRLELQANDLKAQADKLQSQAKQALAQGQEDLAREALGRRATIGEQLEALGTQHQQVDAQAGPAHADLAAALRSDRVLPHQEGDDEGHVPGLEGGGRRGRSGVGDIGIDDRRRDDDAAGPGQDRPDAGTLRGGRRAPRRQALFRTSPGPRPTTSSSS